MSQECIEAKGGHRLPKGYVVQAKQYGEKLAHRIAYAKAHGFVPLGKFVLHSCDNPSCVNPEHLRAGTKKENMRDMRERARHGGRAKLTQEDVDEIRLQYSRGVLQQELAEEYGVSDSSISLIVNYINWPEG